MESKTVCLFGAVICALLVIASAHEGGGGGKKKWMEGMKKCGDGEINVEEAFKGKKECFAEFKKTAKPEGSGNDETERKRRSPHEGGGRKGGKGWGGKGKRNMCVAVCAWKKTGVLDESGQFSESGAKAYVDKVYPESNRAAAFDSMKSCGTENSSKFSMDNNCSGYKDFKKCIMKGHMSTCGVSFDFGGFGGGKKKPQGSSGGGGGNDEEE